VLLSLGIGKTLEEIRAMPARDLAQYRRFYARHPWGPLWETMTAWLSGAIGRQVYAKRPTTLTEAVAMFDPGRRRRRRRRKPLQAGWVRQLAAAIGARDQDGKVVTVDGS